MYKVTIEEIEDIEIPANPPFNTTYQTLKGGITMEAPHIKSGHDGKHQLYRPVYMQVMNGVSLEELIRRLNGIKATKKRQRKK